MTQYLRSKVSEIKLKNEAKTYTQIPHLKELSHSRN